jgi:hypothetical protein
VARYLECSAHVSEHGSPRRTNDWPGREQRTNGCFHSRETIGNEAAMRLAGRVKALLETGSLPCDRVRMFVLDEADKLLERKLRDQIKCVYVNQGRASMSSLSGLCYGPNVLTPMTAMRVRPQLHLLDAARAQADARPVGDVPGCPGRSALAVHARPYPCPDRR